MSHPLGITYVAREYDTQRERLMGRHSASESFLRAWANHGDVDHLAGLGFQRADHEDFDRKLSELRGEKREFQWVHLADIRSLARLGTVYTPDPNLGRLAWSRRRLNDRAYSILGVTHTLASDGAMDLIGNLLTTPTQA